MAKNIVTANPATVELTPAPFPREWIIDGTPEARAREIARSDDGTMRVMVWSCTPGKFRWEYSIDETVQIVSGDNVGGNVQVNNNTNGSVGVGGNVIGGNLRCMGNSQQPGDDGNGPNTVSGHKLGQCSSL